MFQPFRYAPLLLGLLACGLVALVTVPRWRVGLLPAGFALWLLLSTAFLSGALPRYRYPVDPLLAVVIGGGAVGLGLGAGRLLRMARRPSPDRDRAPAAVLAGGASTPRIAASRQ